MEAGALLSDLEVWAGGGSAAVAVIGGLFRSWQSLDKRLRAVELGVARIEVAVGAKTKRKHESDPPDSDD